MSGAGLAEGLPQGLAQGLSGLATPVGLYALVLLGFVLVTRLRALWGRVGLVLLSIFTLAGGVTLVAFPGWRRVWLSEGLAMPSLVVVAVAFALWSFLDEERRGRETEAPAAAPYFPARELRWAGWRRGELLVFALAVVLAGILAVWAEPPLPALDHGMGGGPVENLSEDLAPTPAPTGDWPWFLAPWIFWRGVLGAPMGGALPLLVVGLLFALPWIDPDDPDDGGRHRLVLVILGAGLGLALVPMILFELAVPLAEGRALSSRFWEGWLGRSAPRAWFWRELPGLVLLAIWFLLPTFVLPRWRASRGLLRAYRRRLGKGRFLFAMVALALLVLPVALLLGRELFGLGPWIDPGPWGAR